MLIAIIVLGLAGPAVLAVMFSPVYLLVSLLVPLMLAHNYYRNIQ